MRLGNTMLLFMNLGKQLYQFFRYPEKWQTSVPIWRISTPGWYYFQMVPWYYTFPKLEGTSACVEYHFVLRYKHRIWPTVHAIFTGWHRKPRDIPTVTLRYWIQESSLMKYPTHPLGLGPQAAFAGPRDVWDISFRMIPSSNIAKYSTRQSLMEYFPIFNGILSLEAAPLMTKYRWISGNIPRGFAEWNISR